MNLNENSTEKKNLLNSLKNSGIEGYIIDAFSKVKREEFMPKELKQVAYKDTSQPIGHGQTISQPYTIGLMLMMLNPKKSRNINKVLEIGSGSGYVLALMSEIYGKNVEIYGIERLTPIYENSIKNLKNYSNVKVYNKNGFDGLKEHGPFDRILISAAIDEIPKVLVKQLNKNGVIVAPIYNPQKNCQDLVAYQKQGNKLVDIDIKRDFLFVPFINP